MSLSCTREEFVLGAAMRAFEGDAAVCERGWKRRVGRRLV